MLNIGLLLKKYSVSILFLNFGLALVYVAFTSEQSLTFKLAASLVFIAALISFRVQALTLNLFGVFWDLLAEPTRELYLQNCILSLFLLRRP